jgi:hypothetical protein
MFYSRLLAGICFFSFAFALGATLRLVIYERARPLAIGDARHLEDLAARPPTSARDTLRTAVRLNPRDSTAWMALGLAAERDGAMEPAAHYFLAAENVDRQYLPAWTSANFFFRSGNDAQFWRAATQAAAMSYDDPAPLIELADHRQPNAIATLGRLGDSARLERGYLYFLIAQSRWSEAEEVGARLSSRGDAQDRELLLNFTDRLIGANQSEAALTAWNRLRLFPALDRAHRGILVNPNFRMQPSGHGFDWRMTAPPRGSAHWETSHLDYWLSESTPDACTLLEQWLVLDPGRYRLRFEYRTEGLAKESGLRWALLQSSRVQISSADFANSTEWNFEAAKAGLYELAWIYVRVPGTTRQEGRAELASASLELR